MNLYKSLYSSPRTGVTLPVSASSRGLLCVSIALPTPTNIILQQLLQQQQQKQQQQQQQQRLTELQPFGVGGQEGGSIGGGGSAAGRMSTEGGERGTEEIDKGLDEIYAREREIIVRESIKAALQMIRGQLAMYSFHLGAPVNVSTINVVKNRYIIYTLSKEISLSNNENALMDQIKSIDIYTNEHCICKLIDEPEFKVRQAYFKLQQPNNALCYSRQYGHSLIRPPKDIIALTQKDTLVIVSMNDNSNYHYNQNYGQTIGFANITNRTAYGDLHKYVQNKGRLSEAEARSLFYQICEIVLNCHQNGIILRDIKLKRFYFTDEAQTMLQCMSLETAKIMDNPHDDILNQKIGCLYYVAPELLDINPNYHGKAADVWSLGVILYTMTVGHYPFRDKVGHNLLSVIYHHNIQFPTYLSPSLQALLSDLLHKNYKERIPVSYIFLSPWLKNQSQSNMHVPLNLSLNGSFNAKSHGTDFNIDGVNEGNQQ